MSSLARVPLFVLTGMQIDPGPGMSDDAKRAFNTLKLDAHAAFAKSLPRGEDRAFDDAGYFLYIQRPDAVADAIFAILDQVAAHEPR